MEGAMIFVAGVVLGALMVYFRSPMPVTLKMVMTMKETEVENEETVSSR